MNCAWKTLEINAVAFESSSHASLTVFRSGSLCVYTLVRNPLPLHFARSAEKIEQTEGKLSHSGRGLGMGFFLPGDASSKGGGENGKGEETPLSKVARESMLLAAENIKSQAGQVTKDLLFNFRKMHVHHSDSMDDTCHPMES